MLTKATNQPPCLVLDCERCSSERVGDGWPRAIRGFTLLEILVALSMLGLILGAAYGSYRAVTSSIVDLEPRLDLNQKGRFYIQRLTRQIRCCYGGRGDQAGRSVPDQNDVKRPASQEQMRFFQGSLPLSDGAMLRFVTTSSGLNRKSNIGSLAVVSYKVDALQHTMLTHEEIYGRQTNEGDEDWRVVLEDLVEIEFQYFDGKDWQEQWDSNVEGGPPRALRIKLALESKQDGASAHFASAILIRCFAPKKLKSQVQEVTGGDKDRGQANGKAKAHAQ